MNKMGGSGLHRACRLPAKRAADSQHETGYTATVSHRMSVTCRTVNACRPRYAERKLHERFVPRRHAFWLTGTLFVVAASAMSASVAVAAPTPTLVDATARLDYNATKGSARLVLQVDGLSAQDLQDPELVKKPLDLGVPTPPPKVDIRATPLQPVGTTSRTWLLFVNVDGLPANMSQNRHVTVDVAGKTATFPYTLTNKAVANFTWTVKTPSSVAIEPGDAIPVGVSVGAVPATGVTLINPFLTEKDRKVLIAPNGLRLCRNSTGPCAAEKIDLPASFVTQLWLQGAEGIGQYEGTVTLASAEKPEGEALTLTVYSTTTWHKVVGVLAILLGVVAAWLVTVFGRNLLNRAQLLLPAAVLRQRVGTLQPLPRDPTGGGIQTIHGKITELMNRLMPAQLELVGLPRWFPVSTSIQLSAEDIEKYRKAVQEIANWVVDLEAIVHEGLEVIFSKWTPDLPANTKEVFAKAVRNLDQLVAAPTAPPIETVQQQIRAQTGAVNGALQVALAPGTGFGGYGGIRTVEQLSVQIAQVSALMWLVVVIATTTVGALALVLNNSFGSSSDYVKCVLWGLGLPIGSQALSATMTSVGTSLGITIAK
jgi:hypothetical protein